MLTRNIQKDSLIVYFVNKKRQSKKIHICINREDTILDVKKQIMHQFDKRFRPEITDFRLVTRGENELDMNDTIKDNFFDEKYNNDKAYDYMLSLKNSDYYKCKAKEPLIYFRVIKLRISTQIYYSTYTLNFDFPLPIEDNYYEWENKAKEFIRKNKPNIDYQHFHLYQKTENMDEISKEGNMRKYLKDGLVLFLFPIQARFVNNFQIIDILLKFNQPLKEYLKQLKITTDIKNLFIKKKGDDNSFDIIDLNVPVHEIMKKQKKEPVIFEVLEQFPQKVHITIPFYDDFIDINFEYKKEDTILELINSIKSYFNINKKIILLKNGTTEVKNTDKIKGVIYFLLQYKESNQIQLSRSFIINGNHIIKHVSIYESVNSILKEIAKEFDTDKSLITLSIDGKQMNPMLLFASYFIPPEKEIFVKIDKFQEFVNLKIYANKKTPVHIKAGFTPKMKLKSLKKSRALQNEIPNKLLSEMFFFLDDKLDETKTFEHYGIKNGQEINIYASKFFIYKYNNETCIFSAETDFDELMQHLQKHFKLPADQFFIDYGENEIKDKNEEIKLLNAHYRASIISGQKFEKILTFNLYLSSKIPNGKIFQIIKITKMKFIVDDDIEIIANSNQQVKDIMNIFSKKSKTAPDTFVLVNGDEVQLNSNLYLYSIFDHKIENYVYSRKTRKYTFQNNYKFIMEPFLPSTTVGDALFELKKQGKYIKDYSFVIFMGQIIDFNETLGNIFHNIDDDDDAQPLIIENEMPELINICLIFQFEIKDKNEKINIRMVRPTEVLNVHYWASIISGQEFDNISLMYDYDDKPLNDDELLYDDDTNIIINLISIQNEGKNSLDKTEKNDSSELDKTEKNESEEPEVSQSYYIGEEEEKYHQVLSLIGEGEFSFSYKVADTKTDQLMCKKVLKIISNNEVAYKALKNSLKEFETLYKINHPCVCKAIGINTMEPVTDTDIESESGEEITTVALFFEFLEYSLFDCMKIMNNTLKTKIVVEIAHGMNSIHKHGFIHRDLKIENIRLNDIFEAKIIDFGLVRIHECLFDEYSFLEESMTRCVGTLDYMSPEMLNEQEYDYKTDVYSFGVLLHYLFVGSLPKKKLGVIKMPEPSPSISEICIEIISKCLENEPSKRPSFEEILKDIRDNSYSLASYVDKKIVSHRDQELQDFDI